MTTFADRLQHAMTIKNMRACELSRATGLSRARISQYIHGKYTPGADGICRLASILGVSEAWLMGQDATTDAAPLPQGVSPLTLRPLPVLGRIACGQPILAVEDMEDFVAVSDTTNADFGLVARGDSMIGARIFDGDLVFIKSADTVNNGDIAAVVVEEEATLKRVYYYPEEGKLILAPENAAYQPLIFTGEALNQIHILGKAVAVQATL